LVINSFKKYLEIAPKNPPKPIKKIFIFNLWPQKQYYFRNSYCHCN
jgi:hypothetical protein